jgi:hypothetical protein
MAGGAWRGLRAKSPAALVAVLCASALTPVGAAAIGATGAVSVAAYAWLGSVGSGVLAEVVSRWLGRLAKPGGDAAAPDEHAEAELAAAIEAALAAQDASAGELRGEIAEVFRQVGLASEVTQAAIDAGNEEFAQQLADVMGLVGREFNEMGFLLADVQDALVAIQDTLRRQEAEHRTDRDIAERQLTLLESIGRRVDEIGRGPGVHLVRTRQGAPDAVTITQGYANLVRHEIAPVNLLNREAELAELSAFARGTDRYLWLQAPAYAGKTALMSWFVLHAPADVTLVSYFIRETQLAEANDQAFALAVAEQLAAVAGEDADQQLQGYGHHVRYWRLLDQAASVLAADGRRLVLVVDGLDEDHSSGDGIAALLPSANGPEVQVLVSSRPQPALRPGIAEDHPLRRCRIWRIGASPYAEACERLARAELDRMPDDDDAEQILGMLAAAAGGLTGADLASLTDLRQRTVERRLDRDFARSLRVVTRDGERGYIFDHAAIEAEVRVQLRDFLPQCQQRLEAWAKSYQDQGWPAATPGYLLRSYPRVLLDDGDLKGAVSLTLDRSRRELMLQRTGADAMALREFSSVQHAIADTPTPDLRTLSRLAAERFLVTHRNAAAPGILPTVWALIGQTDRAEAVALAIIDPGERASTLRSVARVAADADPMRAAQIARSMDNPDRQAEVLADVAEVTSGSDPERAEEIARSIADPDRQAEALADVAEVTSGSDPERATHIARSITLPAPRARALVAAATAVQEQQPGRARELCREAIAAARSVDHPALRTEALVRAAEAVSATDPVQAVRLCREAGQAAEAIDDPGYGGLLLAGAAAAAVPLNRALAVGLCRTAAAMARSDTDAEVGSNAISGVTAVIAMADLELAEQVAGWMTDPGDGVAALVGIVDALEEGPDEFADRYADLILDSLDLARTITDPDQRGRMLAPLAARVSAFAGGAMAADLRAEAVTAAQALDDPHERAWVLQEIAATAATADVAEAAQICGLIDDAHVRTETLAQVAAIAARRDPDEAEQYARSLAEGSQRDGALAATAEVIAESDPDRGELIARSVTDPVYRAGALAKVAAEIARSDPDRAAALCEQATEAARSAGIAHGPALNRWRAAMPVAAISAALAAVDPERAHRLALCVTDVELKAKTLATVAYVAASTDPDRAIAVAADAAQSSASIADPGPRAEVLATVTAALATADSDLAMPRFAEAASAANSIAYPEDRDGRLAGIAMAIALASPHSAIEIMDSITDPHWKTTARAWVTSTLAVKEPALAEQIARSIDDAERRPRALADVAAALARDDPSHAAEVCELAEGEARRITDPEAKARALAEVATALAVRDRPAALGLYDQAAEAARSVTAAQTRASVLAEVASALGASDPVQAVGLCQEALDASRAVPAGMWLDQVLTEIADSLLACGQHGLDQGRPLLARLLAGGEWSAAVASLAAMDPDTVIEVADILLANLGPG